MKSKKFVVADKLGIHVRVACEIIDFARAKNCELFVDIGTKDGEKIKIESPLKLISLQIRYCDEIEFFASGAEESVESALLEEIGKLLSVE